MDFIIFVLQVGILLFLGLICSFFVVANYIVKKICEEERGDLDDKN